MKKKLYILISIISIFYCSIYCNDYEFNIFNGTMDLCTMEQMDINYQSSSRIINRYILSTFEDVNIFENVSWLPTINIGKFIIWTYPSITTPIVHEEGHRSILTNQSVGSISQPIFNGKGAAYVKGVTDSTLSDLRAKDKPSFIRMYTAGIESDYVSVRRNEMLTFINESEYKNCQSDIFYRILSISGYYSIPSMFYSSTEDCNSYGLYKFFQKQYTITEEDNELERDICGIDVFGAVHYLFDNESSFKRYVQWTDMSRPEQEFAFWRMTYRGLFINLVNPYLFGFPVFHIGENIKLNGSMGYTLAPFGDFIEENIYFAYKNYNFAAYIREFENYKNWSMGFGLKFIDYSPVEWIKISAEGHFWMQPKDLEFYTSEMAPGGAGKISATFMMPIKNEKSIGLNMSLLYKGYGYLPEVESHNSLWRFTSGVTLRF